MDNAVESTSEGTKTVSLSLPVANTGFHGILDELGDSIIPLLVKCCSTSKAFSMSIDSCIYN